MDSVNSMCTAKTLSCLEGWFMIQVSVKPTARISMMRLIDFRLLCAYYEYVASIIGLYKNNGAVLYVDNIFLII